MCLEIWRRFRCGCVEYSTAWLCPHIDAVNSLINYHGLHEDDSKVDKLYEKCDGVGAKRYLAQFSKCPKCLAEMAVAAAPPVAKGGGVENDKRNEAREEDMDVEMGGLEQVVKRR